MHALTILSSLCLMLGPLAAQATEGSGKRDSSCIEVTVDGQLLRDYDCLSESLSRGASAQRRVPSLNAEQTATRPSNQLGLFNRAATGHRMGNAFGHSAFAQRPVPRSNVPLLPSGR